MTARFSHPKLAGTVRAIPSKSVAHRAAIAAALADRPTRILCERRSDDIDATLTVLSAFGAGIGYFPGGFTVTPLGDVPQSVTCDAGESASTLRFLIPVAAACGIDASFFCHGRLPTRPLSPLRETLTSGGVRLSPDGTQPVRVAGKLAPGDYAIPGDVSSQFVTGLLFALSYLSGVSTLSVTGNAESLPYIRMTTDVLTRFGRAPEENGLNFRLSGGMLRSPGEIAVEGDFSNAAFFLAAGAVGNDPVRVTGLSPRSLQGDRRILDCLTAFGARVTVDDGGVTVAPAPLYATRVDCADIPDLLPVLAVVAARADGETLLYNAARTRLKESDRLSSTASMLRALGCDVTERADSLSVRGYGKLCGGHVTSAGDHRIAMAASVASLFADGDVSVTGAEAVRKSYPDFYRDFRALIQNESEGKPCLILTETD